MGGLDDDISKWNGRAYIGGKAAHMLMPCFKTCVQPADNAACGCLKQGWDNGMDQSRPCRQKQSDREPKGKACMLPVSFIHACWMVDEPFEEL